MKTPLTVLLLGLLLAAAGAACSGEAKEEPEAEKLARAAMKKHYEQMTDKQLATKAWMYLVEPNGSKQTRHMWRMSETNEKDEERYVVVFDKPPEIRNTAVLVVEHRDRDDDTWLYLPAIKKSMRIAGTNLRQSWAGTEFSYKDLKRERIDANRYVLVHTEKEAAEPVNTPKGDPPAGAEGAGKAPRADLLVIDAFPSTEREQDEQGYSKRRLWIRNDNFLLVKAEYYDKDGELLKTVVQSDVRPVGVTGKFRNYGATMTNAKGRRTEVKFEEIHIDEGDIDDDTFTLRRIEKAR